MLKRIRLFSIVWLVAVLFFAWGMTTIQFQIFPYSVFEKHLKNIQKFVAGHPDEPVTTIREKLESDTGGIPHRYLIKNVDELVIPEDSTTFSIDDFGLHIEGYYTESISGYFLINGAFNLDGLGSTARILLTSEGKFVGHWILDNINKGNVGVAIDDVRNRILGADRIQQHSWCDPKSLKHLVKSRHSIEVAPDGTYWTLDPNGVIVQYDPDRTSENGELERIRTIHLTEDIVGSNTEFNPLVWKQGLSIRVRKSCRINVPEECSDLFHTNDVQPFVDKRFPTTLGYALLISVRNQNLIMVVDPDTNKILWYRNGLTQQQHDVDYFEGSIYVYDNGPSRGFSRLVKIEFDDPNDGTFGAEVIVDGRELSWFDSSRGQHDVFSVRGNRYHLITNDRKGRVYLFNDKSEPIFAVQNYLKKGSKRNTGIQLRSAIYIPQQQFDKLQGTCN